MLSPYSPLLAVTQVRGHLGSTLLNLAGAGVRYRDINTGNVLAVAESSNPVRLKSLLIDFGNSRFDDRARGASVPSDHATLCADDHAAVKSYFICLSSLRPPDYC